MKTNTPRTLLVTILVGLVAVCFISVTGWVLASPSEEISQAVSASGKKDVKQADADTFLDAVSSVLVAVPQNSSAPYVAAATKMRPDLKEQINAAAQEVYADPGKAGDVDRHRVSRHRRRCTICHNGNTLTLPCHAASHHLQHHPGDTSGPCP